MQKKWTISEEDRKKLEESLKILLDDHIDFISGKKPRKDYPSFQQEKL